MARLSTPDQADYAMRHWTYDDPAQIVVGTDSQKQMFCQMLLATHNPYKPAVIDWPQLSPAALRRVTSLPIWDIAVQTEGRTSVAVAAYAATIQDPLLREALLMDAAEEARHKLVLSKLVEAYHIPLQAEPAYPPPRDPEWAWLRTGYSECIDSFFAFGLFASARVSGYFPEALTETFEPVIQEEARHILFFTNWIAWYRRALPWWRRPWFALRVVAVWVKLISERISLARSIDTKGVATDNNFPANAADAISDISARGLISLCLKENDRRMAGYDKRLLRPTLVPFLAKVALRFMRR